MANEVPTVARAALIRGFDYLAAVALGAAGAVTAWFVVPSSPPVAVEMFLGMVVGVVGGLPALGFCTWLLGGFEILVLAMQVGMFAGMVGVMTSSATVGAVAWEGALAGLLVQMLLHAVDRSFRGEVRVGEGSVASGGVGGTEGRAS